MNKKIPSDIFWYSALAVVAGVSGTLGVWWSHHCLQEERQILEQTVADLRQAERDGATRQNWMQAKTNNALIAPMAQSARGAIDPFHQLTIDTRSLTPDAWKKVLETKLNELAQLAPAGQTDVQDAFGFGQYLVQTPSADELEMLTTQLFAVEMLCAELLKTGSRIHSVKRLAPYAEGGWKVYPFELKFEGQTETLRTFLNRVPHLPWLFVPHQLRVENAHDPDAVLRRVSHAQSDKPFHILSGDETIAVQLRVDLLTAEKHSSGGSQP